MFSAEVQVMVSYMRDSSMTGQRLRRGSVRRMLRYARPYRLQIGVYLAMTVLSAGILTGSRYCCRSSSTTASCAGTRPWCCGLPGPLPDSQW
jgi:hypothetical protein